ncbi:MAG: hypothetical protein H0T62_00290 [Parachlamydiaceae bacterium]|nr:hypothetical protein [Parachlamydiaceae bacterium]
MQTTDISYAKTTFNHLVNPNHISYTCDGINKINETQTNPHGNEYGLRCISSTAEEIQQVITAKFPATLNSSSVFTEMYLQHTTNGIIENWHLRLHYTPQDHRVVELFNSNIEGQKVRPDHSGLILHLDPEISARDKEFFEHGEYQTKYIPAIKLILEIAQEQRMIEVEEVNKLTHILSANKLI